MGQLAAMGLARGVNVVENCMDLEQTSDEVIAGRIDGEIRPGTLASGVTKGYCGGIESESESDNGFDGPAVPILGALLRCCDTASVLR